jgi:hypothetical protein
MNSKDTVLTDRDSKSVIATKGLTEKQIWMERNAMINFLLLAGLFINLWEEKRETTKRRAKKRRRAQKRRSQRLNSTAGIFFIPKIGRPKLPSNTKILLL